MPDRPTRMDKFALCIGVLSALALVLGTFGKIATGYSSFDGWVAEPGCDWGNKNCEPEDYRSMCASYAGKTNSVRWVTYCKDVER